MTRGEMKKTKKKNYAKNPVSRRHAAFRKTTTLPKDSKGTKVIFERATAGESGTEKASWLARRCGNELEGEAGRGKKKGHKKSGGKSISSTRTNQYGVEGRMSHHPIDCCTTIFLCVPRSTHSPPPSPLLATASALLQLPPVLFHWQFSGGFAASPVNGLKRKDGE